MNKVILTILILNIAPLLGMVWQRSPAPTAYQFLLDECERTLKSPAFEPIAFATQLPVTETLPPIFCALSTRNWQQKIWSDRQQLIIGPVLFKQRYGTMKALIMREMLRIMYRTKSEAHSPTPTGCLYKDAMWEHEQTIADETLKNLQCVDCLHECSDCCELTSSSTVNLPLEELTSCPDQRCWYHTYQRTQPTQLELLKRLTRYAAHTLGLTACPEICIDHSRTTHSRVAAQIINGIVHIHPRLCVYPYGFKKLALLHELVHILQLQAHPTRPCPLDPEKYPRGIEQEADTLAALHAGCAQCIQEFAVYRDDMPKAYLSRAELELIAHDIGADKRCPYHTRATDTSIHRDDWLSRTVAYGDLEAQIATEFLEP